MKNNGIPGGSNPWDQLVLPCLVYVFFRITLRYVNLIFTIKKKKKDFYFQKLIFSLYFSEKIEAIQAETPTSYPSV